MIEVKLIKDTFVIADEKDYQRLYSKGFAEKIGKLFTLNLYESCYLVEKGKIKIIKNSKELKFESLMKLKEFNYSEYLVFCELRSKGYIVKTGVKYGFPFRVYDKGLKIKDKHAIWLVEVYENNTKIKITDILSKNRISHTAKKKMLVAIVDSDRSVTFIEQDWLKV